jgi:hypothetical protein
MPMQARLRTIVAQTEQRVTTANIAFTLGRRGIAERYYRHGPPDKPRRKGENMNGNILRAAAAVLMSGGVGLAGLGVASGIAQATPVPAPLYHWCPGDFWDPGWGFNWEWFACHDDWHRDIDGDWHDRDWRPDRDDHHRDDWDDHHGDHRDDHDRDHDGPWQPWPPN